MAAEISWTGEDWMLFVESDGRRRQALAMLLRKTGHWEEVVAGMTGVAVKYDPALLTGEEAEQRLRAFLEKPGRLPVLTRKQPIRLAACTEGKYAPDAALVSIALGLGAMPLGDWLDKRRYQVTMMGFQPGFAYLEDLSGDPLPEIPRLASPRQSVPAGSIGCLGRQLCLYSMDGPGGWPIIGRIANRLINSLSRKRPFLLTPGQEVYFNNLPPMWFENNRV